MDHRHAVVGEDVGAVVGEGQADLVLADGLARGKAASWGADVELRPAQAAGADVVADPVAGVGALLLGPKGDDGLGTEEARDGGVQGQPPWPHLPGPLQGGADYQRRAVELQVQLAQVEAAERGRIAGAQGKASDLGRRSAGVE